METIFECQKYKQKIDIEKTPCPHPDDYCRHRTGCVINRLCMDRSDCRKIKRRTSANDA